MHYTTKTVARRAHKIIRQFRLLFLVTVIYVVSGSLFYHVVEKWHWIDSLYFSVVSLTTVGYGDVTPQTSAGKIFTMFYLIVGIGIFGAFISNVLKSRVAKRALHKYERHIQSHAELEKSSK